MLELVKKQKQGGGGGVLVSTICSPNRINPNQVKNAVKFLFFGCCLWCARLASIALELIKKKRTGGRTVLLMDRLLLRI